MCQLLLGLSLFFAILPAYAFGQVYRDVETLGGNERLCIEHLDLSHAEDPSDVLRVIALVPNIKSLVVAGARFRDVEVKELLERSSDSLHTLILDSTNNTDRGLEKIRKCREGLAIYKSQRLAIKRLRSLSRFVSVETHLREILPEVRAIYGDQFFHEATRVDFSGINDLDNAPCTLILNKELAPIQYLVGLRELKLDGTRINDAGMAYLKRLSCLTRLQIPLEEVSSEGLRNLAGMARLDAFSGSPISDEGLHHFSSMRRLEHLSLGGPELSDESFAFLCGCSNLRTLTVNGGAIRGNGVRHLSSLRKLESLTLGGRIRDLSAIPALRQLKYLHLSGDDLDDSSLTPLAQCKTLETLWLDGTNIGNAGASHLKNIESLHVLSLRHTRIGDAGILSLKELPELRSLDVGFTRITLESIDVLAHFPNLESLSLYGLALSNSGLESAAKLTRLKRLNVTIPLEDNDFESRESKYRWLRSALPNCEVH